MFLVSLGCLLFRCTSDIAGSTDETEIEVIALSGTLIESINNTPAEGALVTLFDAAGGAQDIALDSTYTGTDGTYTFDSLETGAYSVTSEYKTSADTLYAAHRNIVVDTATDIGTDTLKAPGWISGTVSVDGQGSKSNIFCYIPGTSYLAITDTGGSFSIYNIPPGTYDLSYWHQKYNDTTISGVTVSINKETTVPHMKLYVVINNQTKSIYGVFDYNYSAIAECEALVSGDGIEVGKPLTFELDWNPLSHGFSGYIHVPDTGTNWTATIIVYDTLGRKTGFGSVDFTNLSSNVLVPTFNPKNAVPHVNAGPDITASKNDMVSFSGSAIDSFGGTIVTSHWDLGLGVVNDTITNPDDTVNWIYTDTGVYMAILHAVDNDGNIGSDTLLVTVPNTKPVITFVTPSQDTVFWDTLVTVSFYAEAIDSFGGIISKYRWDFDGNGIWDTTVTSNDTFSYTFTLGTYSILCAATDDDSNETIDTLRIAVSYALQVSAGADYSLFVKKDGTVWGCGDGFHGKLGNGSNWPPVETPTKILGGIASVSAGIRHSGFIKTDGTVWQTGDNDNGELGNGISGYDEYELNPVYITNNVKIVSPGEDFTQFVKTDNSLWACGRNDLNGQLGIDSISGAILPAHVMNNVIAVTTGKDHTLIIKTDNTLWTWGGNIYGQLGNGKSGQNEEEFSPIQILDNVKGIEAGWNHTMIIKTDNTLWACGINTYGQLGNGKSGNNELETTPVHITDNVKAVSAGKDFTLIIKTDNSLWACGNNEYGQYGNGTTTNSNTPVKLLDNVSSASAGGGHTLIIKTDGSIWSSGLNDAGQVGDGTSENKTSWMQIFNK